MLFWRDLCHKPCILLVFSARQVFCFICFVFDLPASILILMLFIDEHSFLCDRIYFGIPICITQLLLMVTLWVYDRSWCLDVKLLNSTLTLYVNNYYLDRFCLLCGRDEFHNFCVQWKVIWLCGVFWYITSKGIYPRSWVLAVIFWVDVTHTTLYCLNILWFTPLPSYLSNIDFLVHIILCIHATTATHLL